MIRVEYRKKKTSKFIGHVFVPTGLRKPQTQTVSLKPNSSYVFEYEYDGQKKSETIKTGKSGEVTISSKTYILGPDVEFFPVL